MERQGAEDHGPIRIRAGDRSNRSRNGSTIAITPLEAVLRVFTTLRGHHYVPSTCSPHWNRVRCTIGLGNTSLYECTRHCFAWYLLNVAELPDHVVAAQLRHDDGGTLVRELYGRPDAAMARERIRAAFRSTAGGGGAPGESRN